MLTLEKAPALFNSTLLAAFDTGLYLGADFATGFERFSFENGEWVNREGQNVHEFVSDCFENYNQYSPWEVTASYWNSFGEWSCEIWDRFEAGLVEGAVGVDSGD
jgi:hypothetical protein